MAVKPWRCRRCLVAPVKSHSMPISIFKNMKKCFARMLVSQTGLVLLLNSAKRVF